MVPDLKEFRYVGGETRQIFKSLHRRTWHVVCKRDRATVEGGRCFCRQVRATVTKLTADEEISGKGYILLRQRTCVKAWREETAWYF